MKPMTLPICLVGLLSLSAACGSRSYLIESADYARVTQSAEAVFEPLPAVAEPTQERVFVNPQKMKLDKAAPLPDARLRVRPRRPLGHLIGGGITFGLGAVLTAAGAGQLYCPPGYFCENGIAVAALLGVGSFHMLIGGIVLIVGGARYSPEVPGVVR